MPHIWQHVSVFGFHTMKENIFPGQLIEQQGKLTGRCRGHCLTLVFQIKCIYKAFTRTIKFSFHINSHPYTWCFVLMTFCYQSYETPVNILQAKKEQGPRKQEPQCNRREQEVSSTARKRFSLCLPQ